MKLTHKDMVEQALRRIEYIQKLLEQYHIILSFLHRDAHTRSQTVNTGDIYQHLINDELTEWRNLFMWALTLDDAERDRIKAAAHARFLSEGKAVSRWWNDGVSPGQWLSADEEAFRDMARKAFGPKEPK